MLAVTDAGPFLIEDGTVGVNFTFRLFEADGVTPVQIALATPEPASWWFAGCGCLCLLALGRRRRNLSPTPCARLASEVVLVTNMEPEHP